MADAGAGNAGNVANDALNKELAERVEILMAQGLGDQCKEHMLADPPVAIYCRDYSSIGPLEKTDPRVVQSLQVFEQQHPGAHPHYMFGYHWRDEPDEDEDYTDDMAILYTDDMAILSIDADPSKWEAQKQALKDNEPQYFNVRFVGDELAGGDGDYCDYIGSLGKLSSSVGSVLEINYEDEV